MCIQNKQSRKRCGKLLFGTICMCHQLPPATKSFMADVSPRLWWLHRLFLNLIIPLHVSHPTGSEFLWRDDHRSEVFLERVSGITVTPPYPHRLQLSGHERAAWAAHKWILELSVLPSLNALCDRLIILN